MHPKLTLYSRFYFAPDAGIESCVTNASNPLYPSCANTSYTYSAQDGGWAIGAYSDPLAPWLHKATDWLPAFLHYIADTWAGGRPIVVSEFGFAEPFEARKTILQDILYDPIRTSYYHDYMRGILTAMSEGVNVAGCLAWSLYDNFEWASGFDVRFGYGTGQRPSFVRELTYPSMQYVNFSDPELPRYYKASFFEYKRTFDIYQEK